MRSLAVITVLAVALLACRDSAPQSHGEPPSPDGQGVLHDLTEASAAEVTGFQPQRPARLPEGLAIQELWVQASILEGTTSDQPPQWGAPFVTIYEIQPKDEAAMQGPTRGIQLHQSTVDPIPTDPGGIADRQPLTIGTQVVQKSVNPIGTSEAANVVYRWQSPSTGLHMLAIASMRDVDGVEDVEEMIAAMLNQQAESR